MNWKSLLAMLVVALFVVGCASQAPAPSAPAPSAPAPAPAPVVAATPGVEFVSAPAQAVVGQSFSVSWKVTGADSVDQTDVVYSTKSHASETVTASTYQSRAPKTAFTGDATKQFETSLIFGDVVTLYARAHAVVGGMDYWSAEQMIAVGAPMKKMSADATMPAGTETDSMEVAAQ